MNVTVCTWKIVVFLKRKVRSSPNYPCVSRPYVDFPWNRLGWDINLDNSIRGRPSYDTGDLCWRMVFRRGETRSPLGRDSFLWRSLRLWRAFRDVALEDVHPRRSSVASHPQPATLSHPAHSTQTTPRSTSSTLPTHTRQPLRGPWRTTAPSTCSDRWWVD